MLEDASNSIDDVVPTVPAFLKKEKVYIYIYILYFIFNHIPCSMIQVVFVSFHEGTRMEMNAVAKTVGRDTHTFIFECTKQRRGRTKEIRNSVTMKRERDKLPTKFSRFVH